MSAVKVSFYIYVQTVLLSLHGCGKAIQQSCTKQHNICAHNVAGRSNCAVQVKA